jgi:hypothetical protein
MLGSALRANKTVLMPPPCRRYVERLHDCSLFSVRRGFGVHKQVF